MLSLKDNIIPVCKEKGREIFEIENNKIQKKKIEKSKQYCVLSLAKKENRIVLLKFFNILISLVILKFKILRI